MLAVLSLLGLLVAGFALDAGTNDDSPPEEDGTEAGGMGPATGTGDLLDAPEKAAAGDDGWDDLYGEDGAGELYGGFDALFGDAPPPPIQAEPVAQQEQPANAADIADYDPAEDCLVVGYDPTGGTDPTVTVTESEGADGRVAEIRLDGVIVCRVALAEGDPAITPADVALVPNDSLEALEQA